MIEDYRYTKRDLDQAYKRGYHKSIAEFLEKLRVINRNYKGLIEPIQELIEEYEKWE